MSNWTFSVLPLFGDSQSDQDLETEIQRQGHGFLDQAGTIQLEDPTKHPKSFGNVGTSSDLATSCWHRLHGEVE